MNDDEKFEKQKSFKNKIHSMQKIDGKLFISTNLENVMFDGENVTFMKDGFPQSEIKDVFNYGGKHGMFLKAKL